MAFISSAKFISELRDKTNFFIQTKNQVKRKILIENKDDLKQKSKNCRLKILHIKKRHVRANCFKLCARTMDNVRAKNQD